MDLRVCRMVNTSHVPINYALGESTLQPLTFKSGIFFLYCIECLCGMKLIAIARIYV